MHNVIAIHHVITIHNMITSIVKKWVQQDPMMMKYAKLYTHDKNELRSEWSIA